MDHPEISGDVAAAARDAVDALWARDHRPWGEMPDEITDRLGWLDAPDRAVEEIPHLQALARAVIADGCTSALLVGMGGSSLYPQVLAGLADPSAVSFGVLDSTDPAAVLAAEAGDWTSTLLVPASKSGTTIETRSHLDYFSSRLQAAGVTPPGGRIVAVTDPHSALDEVGARDYLAVVHGQPDVGGRFSALTAFGLWPAALLGIDLAAHVAPARDALERARSGDLGVNDGAALGAVLAQAARGGRDKLTLLVPDTLADFAAWVEQLVAESTGKHGRGLLPVLGETPDTASFGNDRIVVVMDLAGDDGTDHRSFGDAPVVRWRVDGAASIAAEVVRWEVATAVCSALLGVNAFDQPDVARAKAATQRVLAAGEELPRPGDPGALLDTLSPGDYVALLGFVTPGGDDEAALHRAGARIRARYEVPVTVGIGPRYLHSTGQYHKGGRDRGVFLVVVGDDPVDVDIPGRDMTFGRLKRAQAAGDLAAFDELGRRATHVALDDLL
ncbi:MAG: hypothetical protein WD011_03495 [Nitriliruptoraceae bacterium]